MQCPICGNENKESLCPLCGYDLSLCREHWPTPADDGRRPDSIRKLRARRAWERPEGQSAPAQPQPEAYPTQPQPAAYPTQPQPAAYPTQPQPAEYRHQPQPAEYRPQPHSDPAPAASSRSVEAKKKSGSRMKLILAAAALGVLLLGVVLIVVLSGKNGDSGSETASGADALASGSPAQTEASQTEEEPAVKVNHINRNEKDGLRLDNGWIVYTGDDGRKGLISLDGKVDTGAVYSRVSCYDADAEVTTDSSAVTTDPASLNRYGLLNGAGELVLPEAYARFKLCGRYVVAYQVTEITADSTHALCKFAKNSFSKTQTDDVYYNGTWTVFDRKTGAFVPGLSGTRDPSAKGYGDYISYQKYNAEGKWHDCVVGPDGTELPGDATLLENGTYVLRAPGSAAVYRSDGSVVFEYDPTAFSVCFQPMWPKWTRPTGRAMRVWMRTAPSTPRSSARASTRQAPSSCSMTTRWSGPTARSSQRRRSVKSIPTPAAAASRTRRGTPASSTAAERSC